MRACLPEYQQFASAYSREETSLMPSTLRSGGPNKSLTLPRWNTGSLLQAPMLRVSNLEDCSFHSSALVSSERGGGAVSPGAEHSAVSGCQPFEQS